MADDSKLLEEVLYDSNQVIQISDLETFSMLYANKAAKAFSGRTDSFEGRKCYEYLLGRSEQCPFCPIRQMGDRASFDTEVDNGEQIFAVKSKLINWNGRKAFVEYSWDITSIRRSEKNYERQISLLMASIPNAQGVFHFDLTDDAVLGLNGVSREIKNFNLSWTVDETILAIAKFITDEKSRKSFFARFCRENLQRLFIDGKVTDEADYFAYFDDESIHPSRVCARLVLNPKNSHLECILYVRDVSKEKLQRELHQNVISALSRDFRNVYLVNLEKGDLSVIKLDGYLTQGLHLNPEKRFPYKLSCNRYVEDRVHPDDRAMMHEALSAENVLAHLKNQNDYVGTYRILENGETHYCQYKFVKVEGSAEVVAGFQNVDAVVAVERERQAELTRLLEQDQFRKQVLYSLAKIYFCIYYVDLETGIFQEMGKTNVVSIQKNIGETGNAREKLKLMSEKLVVPEHSQMIAVFTNLDTLASRLQNRDSVSTRFNGANIGWCEGSFVAVARDEKGCCTKALWVIRSIKDDVAKEEAYKNQLKYALEKAEHANAAKSGFLARMSHDIRTPLNGIIGILDLADKRKYDPEVHSEYRQKARIAANHLLSLLNDVLEMSKLEDSDTQLMKDPFNLLQILSEVYTIANLRAGENSVSIVHDHSVNLKYVNLLGSPLHIRQIFLNLLTNAIKYNKVGGTVYCYSEMVAKTPDTVFYCFHVDDTGIGMKPEFLKHIFEPFAQERSDARSTYQGTGMGMAIVKRLVEKMHGIITVTSEFGKGTHFTVTIPFAINDKPLKQEHVVVEEVPLEGMKILLVEDNELNMEIARSLLEDMGVVVTCACNGEEAVQIFEHSREGSIDLILMDLMMPVLDGYGATKRIRLSKKKDGPQIPIVALSANAFVEDVQKSKDAGMNAHLAKPINISQLKRILALYRK